MAKRDKRKNTSMKNARRNSLRKNTKRKNTRRKIRKNTKRKNTRKNIRRKKLFGGLTWNWVEEIPTQSLHSFLGTADRNSEESENMYLYLGCLNKAGAHCIVYYIRANDANYPTEVRYKTLAPQYFSQGAGRRNILTQIIIQTGNTRDVRTTKADVQNFEIIFKMNQLTTPSDTGEINHPQSLTVINDDGNERTGGPKPSAITQVRNQVRLRRGPYLPAIGDSGQMRPPGAGQLIAADLAKERLDAERRASLPAVVGAAEAARNQRLAKLRAVPPTDSHSPSESSSQRPTQPHRKTRTKRK